MMTGMKPLLIGCSLSEGVSPEEHTPCTRMLARSLENRRNGRTDLAGCVSYLNHNRHSAAGAARRPIISITPATSPGAPPAQSTSAQTPTNRHKNRAERMRQRCRCRACRLQRQAKALASLLHTRLRCFRAAPEPRRCCTIRPLPAYCARIFVVPAVAAYGNGPNST